jgi:hypothetical protein
MPAAFDSEGFKKWQRLALNPKQYLLSWINALIGSSEYH